MDKADIHITDISRILMGQVPPEFLIEVAIRILFLSILLLFSMRLMGKRMAARLSRSEMAAIVSLSATVGIPMQTPDKGLLPAVVVAMVFIGFLRLIAFISARNKKLEKLSQGDIDIIVKDGCLQMDALKHSALSRPLVFAKLRSEGVDNLGKIERLYLESNGAFTLKKFDGKCVGLSLFPDFDVEMQNRQKHAADCMACKECGNLNASQAQLDSCSNCNNSSWVKAVEGK